VRGSVQNRISSPLLSIPIFSSKRSTTGAAHIVEGSSLVVGVGSTELGATSVAVGFGTANLTTSSAGTIVIAREADPTYRISKLKGATNKPVSISPTADLTEAVTVMLSNDFSELPVMSGERDVKGVISWQSLGTRLSPRQSSNVGKGFDGCSP